MFLAVDAVSMMLPHYADAGAGACMFKPVILLLQLRCFLQ
jgi:hypothetical protein